MSKDVEEGLWSRSPAWRWVFVLTCLASAIVILLNPLDYKTNASPVPTRASYKQSQNQSQSQSQPTGNLPTPSTPIAVTLPHSSSDSAFNLNVVPLNPSFPVGTELHLIGVYEGLMPNGEEDKPWWANCSNLSDPKSGMECHSKYAGKHNQKIVVVNVSRTSAPIILVLMSYEPELWKINLGSGINIQKVILSGHYGQDIEGIPENIPVDLYTNGSSNCKICTRQGGYFHTYKKDSPEYTQVVNKLYSLTGFSPTTFQGAYQNGQFYLTNSTSRISGTTLKKTNSLIPRFDHISNKTFVDRISLGGKKVPLPEGQWLGITYSFTDTNSGTDEIAILAQTENKQLKELIAIRAQTVNDAGGFPSFMACLKNNLHKSLVEQNIAFGDQLCYWVNHNADPWKEPIFSLAESKLNGLKITTPNLLINSGFHKADKTSSLTVFYLANPETKGINTTKASWESSEWHPKNIKSFPNKENFVEERIDWSKNWFQIFRATSD